MVSGRSLVGTGAALALCAGVGVAAGFDAGGHVDRFYTAPPVRSDRAPAVPQSSPYDWEQPPADSTTWASATQGQSVAIVGSSRGDGSDLTEIDRAVERAGAVRVHRPRPARVEPVTEQPDDETAVEPVPAT